MKILWYEDYTFKRDLVVAADKILRFSKKLIADEDITIIHLVNGEYVLSSDSIKTLVSRLENEESR